MFRSEILPSAFLTETFLTESIIVSVARPATVSVELIGTSISIRSPDRHSEDCGGPGRSLVEFETISHTGLFDDGFFSITRKETRVPFFTKTRISGRSHPFTLRFPSRTHIFMLAFGSTII